MNYQRPNSLLLIFSICTFTSELARRQEELRLIEEEMQNKRQMAQMGRPNQGPPGGMMGNRNPQFDNRGPPRGQRFENKTFFLP